MGGFLALSVGILRWRAVGREGGLGEGCDACNQRSRMLNTRTAEPARKHRPLLAIEAICEGSAQASLGACEVAGGGYEAGRGSVGPQSDADVRDVAKRRPSGRPIPPDVSQILPDMSQI